MIIMFLAALVAAKFIIGSSIDTGYADNNYSQTVNHIHYNQNHEQ